MTDADTAERDDDLDEAGALEGAPDLAQEEAPDLAQEEAQEAQEAQEAAQDEALDEVQEAHEAPDDGLDEGLDEAQVTKSEDQEERLVAEGEIAGDYLEGRRLVGIAPGHHAQLVRRAGLRVSDAARRKR